MVVVISERHGKTVHFDAESLLEQLFGADHFALHPLLVLGPGQFRSGPLTAWARQHYVVPFAQGLMRGGVRRNIDAVVAHVGALFPRNCLSTSQTTTGNAFRVDELGQRTPELLHDRRRDSAL